MKRLPTSFSQSLASDPRSLLDAGFRRLCRRTVVPALLVALCSVGVSEVRAQKAIFDHTGADQVFVVPAGVTRLKVKLWGAGGGHNGGSGAFVTGVLTVTPGETLTVIVGGGGISSITNEAGGYGGGGAGFFGKGGGRSALRRGASELVTAGAGGGGRYSNGAGGGAGGLLSGGDGWLFTSSGFATVAGQGGTQSGGGGGGISSSTGGNGQAGSAFQGGSGSSAGPGGGGGYFGGGGGVNSGGGGGGGSSFLANLTEASASVAGQAALNTGASVLPGGAGDPDYAAGIGFGGATSSAGGHGRVVLIFEAPSLIVTSTADTVDPFDNQTSLREALAYAATLAGPRTITFSNSTANGAENFHDGTARTITLGGTQLDIASHITITGPGADRLTISGDNRSRIFYNDIASLSASGLTLAYGNGNNQGGGAIFSTKDLTLTDCRLMLNRARNSGCAVHLSQGTLEVIRSTFSGNGGTGIGGAIFVSEATFQITDCVFSENVTSNSGGAIACSAGLSGTIRGATFSNNESLDGGALFIQDSDVRLLNSTFSGNRVINGSGGAIYALGLFGTSEISLVNCSFVGNSATTGGGIYLRNLSNPVTLSLANTILSGNSAPSLAQTPNTTFLSLGHNLCSDGGGGFLTHAADQINTDPRLSPLLDFGGPTPTHALLAGSPALDAGSDALAVDENSAALATDQRGKARQVGTVDIGAYEAPARLVVTNTADSGAGSLRDALDTANGTPADEMITFDIPRTDAGVVNGVATITLTSGQLTVNSETTAGQVVISNATGASRLQISGNNASRVCLVAGGARAVMDGLTLTRGNPGQSGGGVRNFGTVLIHRCLVFGNVSAGPGAGLANDSGTMTLFGTTVSGNHTTVISDGGGIANSRGTLNVINSTISGNSSTGTGGIANDRGTLHLTNVTVTANSATDGSPGGVSNVRGSVNVRNSIVAGNSATGPEVDLYTLDVPFSPPSTITSQGFNLFGGTTGATIDGDLTGNIVGQPSQLAPLGYYGGTTPTHALLPDSPAINNGTVIGAPLLDQRGAGRSGNVDIGAYELNANFPAPLPAGNTTDAYTQELVPDRGSYAYTVKGGSTLPPGLNLVTTGGSVAFAGTPTGAGTFTFILTATDGTSSFETAYTVTITDTTPPAVTLTQAAGQADPVQIAQQPIHFTAIFSEPVTGFDTGDVTLSAPAGATATVTEIAPNDGTTYDVAVSGATALGQVTVSIAAGMAQDAAGNPSLASTGADNTVTIAEVPSLTVTTTSDASTNTDGLTSLREAIANAKTLGGAQTVRFNGDPAALPRATGPGVVDFHDGVTHTLEARTALIINNQSLTITGTNAERLILRNVGNASFLLSISDGSTVDLSGMTVTGAASSGIRSRDSTLTLRGCAVSGNAVASDNVTGGGIFNTGGNLTLVESTVSDNAVQGVNRFGGGIYNLRGTVLLKNSTVSGNSLSGIGNNYGAGIYNESNSTMILVNSTVSGNSSIGGANFGAGIYSGGTLELTNCTVTDNSASSGADIVGGVANLGTAHVRNSIISGNTGGGTPDLSGSLATDVNNLIGDQPDLRLAPLAANGGPTMTHALLPGSSAIDAAGDLTTVGTGGVNASATTIPVVDSGPFVPGLTIRIGVEEMIVIAADTNAEILTVQRGANGTTASAHAIGASVNYVTDQRGQSRIRGGIVDIGAFESASSRLYIDQSVTGGDVSGDSWANAMPELRTATAMAQTDPNVSEIWVARGTYKPAAAGGDRAATFRLRSGLAIYGGFTGTETQLDQRNSDPATNATILSGDLNGNDAMDFVNNGENSYHVVIGSNTDPGAVISGFTVTGGNANGSVTESLGGGIYLANSDATLTNLDVNGNSAIRGGGVYISYGNGTVSNLTISGNSATSFGGGLAGESDNLTLINLMIVGNSAESGGGLQIQGSFSLVNVTIAGNSAAFQGGGVYTQAGILAITNSVISGNTAALGGGVYSLGTTASLTNVTLSGNSASLGVGGGVYHLSAPASLRNCVVWGNAGGAIESPVNMVAVSHSIVQQPSGTYAGTGNLNVDPQFATPITAAAPTTTGNLRLRSTSAAVNAGDNSVVTAATDLDGAARIIGANVDMGAYELIAPPILTNTQLSIVSGGSLTDLATLTGSAPAGGVFTGTGVSVDGNGRYFFDSSGLILGTQVTITYTVNGIAGTSNETTATITVTETPSLTVTTTSDASTNIDGLTSLREAIDHAKTLGGAQTVRFNGDPAALPRATGAGVVDFHDGATHTLEARTTLTINNQSLTITGTNAERLILRNVVNAGTLLSISGGSRVDLLGMTVTGAAASGISNQNSTLNLRGCVVSGNAVNRDTVTGGGIFNFGGSLTLVECTVSDNAVWGDNQFGGGIYNSRGTVTLRNSTVSGNSLSGSSNNRGAGIYNEIDSTMILVNSTVSGNSSIGGNSYGAGIYSVGTLKLINCTVTNNSASGGSDMVGGVANLGTAHVRNSIISGNTGGATPDLFGSLATDLNNLIGDQPSLRLASLAANGGPTMTHALLPGSSAIDAGDNSLAVDESSAALTNDQRGTGFARIVKGSRSTATATVDIGAFELFAAPRFTSDALSLSIAAAPLDLAMATGVSPAGGVFSGPGVSGGFFDPRNQAPGVYTLTYTVTDAFGVSNFADFTVTVGDLPPSLTVTGPQRFKTTSIGSRSRPGRITIRNVGGLPTGTLRVSVSGPGKKDFIVTQPGARELAAGELTVCEAVFRPRKTGNRRASVTVYSDAPPVSVTVQGRGRADAVLRPPRAVRR